MSEPVLSKRRLAESVIEAFRSEIVSRGITDINIRPEASLLSYFSLYAEFPQDPLGVGRADLVITRELDWTPPSIGTIQELNRWFPDDTLEVPVSVIELSINPPLSVSEGVLLDTIKELGEGSSILPAVIVANGDGSSSIENYSGSPIRHIFLSDIDEATIVESAVNPILEHGTGVSDSDLIADLDVEEKLNRFDPELFHFNEVLRAYSNSRNKILIILLSVFFERYIRNLREKTLDQVKENPHAGDFVSRWQFKNSLDACRFFGTISESDYEIINEVRDARNDYAHDLDTFHDTYSTNIEDSDRLEDAIQLYEDLIGVKNSMVDN